MKHGSSLRGLFIGLWPWQNSAQWSHLEGGKVAASLASATPTVLGLVIVITALYKMAWIFLAVAIFGRLVHISES